ncbi:MAG TPA: hypothetical protein VMV10_00950 [Pirellulales bacterium]|nr:hypothetical protein [Pirellulales bacterium]
MRDFMKGGLFCLFIAGLGTCGLAAISGAVVMLVESPLFGTHQLELLFAMGTVFGAGLATSVLSAIAYAALDYVDHKFPAPRRLKSLSDDEPRA